MNIYERLSLLIQRKVFKYDFSKRSVRDELDKTSISEELQPPPPFRLPAKMWSSDDQGRETLADSSKFIESLDVDVQIGHTVNNNLRYVQLPVGWQVTGLDNKPGNFILTNPEHYIALAFYSAGDYVYIHNPKPIPPMYSFMHFEKDISENSETARAILRRYEEKIEAQSPLD